MKRPLSQSDWSNFVGSPTQGGFILKGQGYTGQVQNKRNGWIHYEKTTNSQLNITVALNSKYHFGHSWVYKIRSETRCPGGSEVSVFCLASRTCHGSNEVIYGDLLAVYRKRRRHSNAGVRDSTTGLATLISVIMYKAILRL